ncbi:MAG: helix-turn-helix transcriptional regulator [Clostridiales bacterium]|jgi:transcriptional regulator with XRE-family HTH domain|nr:helix-turn-helix transcriptional regulator [Clostridiales bacterium]
MIFFCNRLKSCRKALSLTQKETANGLQLTERAYQHYEAGTREPGLTMLVKLADFFDVSLDYLVGRSDDPKRH